MSEFAMGATHIEMDESVINNAKVKVFGVGGAGGNTVNRMVGMNISGVEYYAVNTDGKAIELSLADHKIVIGEKTTKGLGAGMRPDVGRKAAEENIEELKEAMKGADLVFITAGMGGGTGTGAAPVVGNVARELGILTVAVVTKPFRFEGKRRATLGAEGIKNLRAAVDTMIVVDNEKLMGVVQSKDKAMTLDGAFKLTDEILGNAVRSICGIMFNHGLVHVDFADIRTVMTNGGSALMGTGIAEGEDRGIIATDLALSSPLLEDINVEGATGVLVNVCHGENFSMLEYTAAMDHIYEAVGEKGDPNIIMGDIMVPDMGDKVSITIIATGCGGSAPVQEIPVQNVQTISAPVAPQPVVVPATPVNTIPTQPVQSTPRPTAFNFAAIARNTVAMPSVASAPAESVQPSQVTQPASSFSAPGFAAMAPAEESVLGTPNASLRETQEFSMSADVDDMNGSHEVQSASAAEDLSTPAYIRNTIAEQVVPAVPAAKPIQHEEGSLKKDGVNYDVPAFLRGNMGGDIF